jgi:hypothetical protein
LAEAFLISSHPSSLNINQDEMDSTAAATIAAVKATDIAEQVAS